MKFTSIFGLTALAAVFFGGLIMAETVPADSAKIRGQMRKNLQSGNYKDAFEGFSKLALHPHDEPRLVGEDLNNAAACLQNLNRLDELDDLREKVVEIHKNNWRLLGSAAQNYMIYDHHGFIVAGKFHRGNKRGGGKLVNAQERDRIRALQLMVQALPLAQKDDDHGEVSGFLLSLGEMFLNNRGYGESWRLQYLSDLKTLPDYDPGWGYYREGAGAPVGEDGKPIYHTTPKSFAAAKTDGQRWRWCLEQAAEFDPRRLGGVRIQFADFLHEQFGVQTMAQYGWRFGRMDTDDSKEDESGPYALHTLGENETIARLATGIKRFELPDEFDFIKIYRQIADDPQSGYQNGALEHLAQIFENRRQYPQAAEYWRRLLKEHANQGAEKRKEWQQRLDQIEKNWGRFEAISTQPAGKGASVEYRFRNGKHVDFTAQEIEVDKLLADVKMYLKSRPKQLDWQKFDIANIGYRLIEQNQKQYLGREIAQWSMELEPREKHFDKRVTVTSPLSKPGAYLLTAKMRDGNTNFVVLWVDGTAIVKKPLNGKTFYYVADCVTGKPVARANVEFFGWKQLYHEKPPQYEVLTRNFAEFTDANGQIVLDPARQPNDYQWLAIARTPQGRFAYLGFTNVWTGNWYDAQYNQTKVYTITDRPVYRPDQPAKYKFWIRRAQYDMEDVSDFAEREFTVEIYNPKGEKIVSEAKKTDAWGGIEGEYKIPAEAPLGVYRLNIKDHGGGSFRVEEYKKPEYEVTIDAPDKPVMLGEKITATIKAKYYFGSPVTKAKVKYKVQRTSHDGRWFPVCPWDWFYGPGYWWFAYDYDWYPGWKHWGCLRPMPFWWPRGQQPPELVADREVEIGEDGTVKVEIDTAVAKAIHPDQDHSYAITAEVIDASRRTIVGTGNVLVARKPFSVYAWVNKGYYRVGDAVRADFSARTPDGKPVEGTGELALLKITYEKDKNGQLKPVETPVQTWKVDTNAEGTASQQMTASQAGQYRISYKLTGGEGLGAGGEAAHTIEGGYLFTVIGEGFDGAQFRFNHVELIPEKREYAPGEKVKLQINTDRAGATVLLFLRPANGVYLPPKVVNMQGKSTVEEIAVTKKDMPNFFVEAVTLADGQVYSEAKEIVVPPEKRVLNVEIEPSKETYKPGEKAKVKVRLTDFTGKPFVGSTVVAIYDKSVEYISGGSNVPEIKEFFWKWRRHHHPQTESSLARWFGPMNPRGGIGMNDLGVFGGSVADDLSGAEGEGAGMGGGPMAPSGGGVRMYGMARGKFSGGMPTRMALADGAMAAPMAAAPMDMMAESREVAKTEEAAPGGGEAPLVQPTIRTKFADTALWVGALTTAKDGTAEVSLDMPENLTTWRIKVWGMGHGTKVGQGQTDVITRKDLIVRLQAPRFFVQTDEVVLSAVVHNYLKTRKKIQVMLELEKCLELTITPFRRYPDGTEARGIRQDSKPFVEIDSDGEARVDWRVKVLDEGEAVIRMKALTDEDSDAMEQKFPCYIHGMLKMDSYSGAIRPKDSEGKFTITVPEKRRPKQSRLEVRYSPTLAGAMVDALPYFVDYPYGCTEQTLNRFLPTVITQKVLLGMNLNLKEIQAKRTNLNAQEIGDDAERAKQWKRFDRNPVFDEEEVRRMVKDGVERLTEMQCSDGGWGWFSGFGEYSSPHTTAVVVHGLQIAKECDAALVPGTLERGVEWLKKYQDEQVQWLKNAGIEKKPDGLRWKEHADDLDAFVYMVLVDADVKNAEMHEFLYRDRTKLSVYSLAMYGIAVEKLADKEKLDMVLRNVGQYVQQDDENQTAWLKLPGGYWWCWYGSEYEAHAYYLKLLAKTDPKGELAPRIVKYLLNNRKNATYWNSTRDTALCLEAFADFIRTSGEDKPEMTVEVFYDGKLQKAVEITPQNLFTFDNKFVLEGEAVAAGSHSIELKKKGSGPLYYNGYATNFTLEDFITKAGLEIKVERKYYKLVKADKTIKAAGSRGQAVDQKVEKYDRVELKNDETLQSGDLVEIEMTIDSKNDYEYLVFEDMKPAGFEPVDLRSGYTGNDLGAYVEFRDNRVVFFAKTLARGKHSVSYRMRAEIPGKFSALPTRASAMYAPELKANSDELKIGVQD
ncbi:MAG: alpha-2-macroglobulin [Pirellulales bacterium]|nr:alpha-2-macroglobulin [Pirellulales bacterium]